MICIANHMPVIQVGDYQVTNYDTSWIRHAIENAANRAHESEFIFVDEIYEGILYYLEYQCSMRLLSLEELYKRIRHMLNRIGFETIASAIRPESPAITISLETIAYKAGNGFELAFYNLMQQEIKMLQEIGVNEVFFSHIEESILLLRQTTTWCHQCSQLENDIMLWLKKEGTKPQRSGRRIRCDLTIAML